MPDATITFSGAGSTTVTTDANGRFAVTNVPDGLVVFVANAPGHLERVSRLDVRRSTQQLVLDLISEAPPFSLDFYREFVRDGFDSAAFDAIRVWHADPRFQLVNVVQDTGEPVPPEVVEGIRRVFAGSVPELSGGRRAMSSFEIVQDGTDTGNGVVRVTFWRVLPPPGGPLTVGLATVGPSGGQGFIMLRYDSQRDAVGEDPGGCESATVRAAEHEIVHTMGFRHTFNTFADFRTGTGCPGSGRPPWVAYHAGVAQSRPYGNRDIDRDPFEFLIPTARAVAPLAVCAEGTLHPAGIR